MPCFVVAASAFRELALESSRTQGLEASRLVVYEGPLKGSARPQVEAWASSVADQVLAVLQRERP